MRFRSTGRNPKLALSAVAVLALSAVTSGAEAKPLTPREIYERTAPGVVLVFGTDGSVRGSAGTGSVVSRDGQVITNAHVVSKNGRPLNKLYVYLKPEKLRGSMRHDLKRRVRVTLVDIDFALDLALLRMTDPPPDLTVLPFVDPEAVRIGDPVVAIGHPETGGLWTLTTGTISSVVADFQGRPGKDVFQTDASVNRGNSGGPLLNAYGQMVGITTSISRKASDGLAITDINFSLKSSVAVEWMKRRDVLHLAYVRPEDERDRPALASLGQTSKESQKPGPTSVEPEVVEPQPGQEVAPDPGFSVAAHHAHLLASRPETVKPASGTAQREAPKQLTKSRPYEWEPFLKERAEEVRELEDMMDDMSRRLDERRGRQRKRADGLGLW